MPQKKLGTHKPTEQHREKRVSSKRSLLIIILIFVVAFVSLAWNWAQDNVFDTVSPIVDRHAENAATVMERARNGVSTNDMAYSVVGSGIDALKTEGTNQRGEIVLRITVDENLSAPLFSKSYAQKCYRYEFPFSTTRGLSAEKIACPQSEPVNLSVPVKRYYKPARDLP